MAKILLVEDDTIAAGHVNDWLTAEQYLVETAVDGTFALEMLHTYEYDCVILDWHLPGLTGVEILKNIRAAGNTVPVLLLTAMNDINYKVEGFNVGADDYLTKPFDARELAARVKGLLRRAAGTPTHVLRAGGVELEPSSRTVTLHGKIIALQPKEFSLLEFLMRNPNKVLNGEQIVNAVWSADSEATSNTVKSYMHVLRKKLSDDSGSSPIKTVHGVGYKLEV